RWFSRLRLRHGVEASLPTKFGCRTLSLVWKEGFFDCIDPAHRAGSISLRMTTLGDQQVHRVWHNANLHWQRSQQLPISLDENSRRIRSSGQGLTCSFRAVNQLNPRHFPALPEKPADDVSQVSRATPRVE